MIALVCSVHTVFQMPLKIKSHRNKVYLRLVYMFTCKSMDTLP